MPPRKRKSPVANTSASEQPLPKRARKPVAETATTTRPKRVSFNPNERADVTTETKKAKGLKSKAAPAANGPGTPGKRGRPRKYPGSTTAPPAASTAAGTPKRGRGRPPKAKTQNSIAKSISAGTPKRGRGRPAKAKMQSSATRGTPEGNKKSSAKPEVDQMTSEQPGADANVESDGRSYWLMKAEPESRVEKGADVKFSIDDLRAAEVPEAWDGVRNFGARNNMRAMKKGDYAFFYHSNCKPPGVAGIMEIVREHSVDETAFDPAHPYYDEKSKRGDPKWDVVHVEFRRKFNNMVTLDTLKSFANAGGPLENLQMMKQTRLSISAVTPEEWRFIMNLAGESWDEAEKPAEKAINGQDHQASGGEVQTQSENPESHGDVTQDQGGDPQAPGKPDAEGPVEPQVEAESHA